MHTRRGPEGPELSFLCQANPGKMEAWEKSTGMELSRGHWITWISPQSSACEPSRHPVIHKQRGVIIIFLTPLIYLTNSPLFNLFYFFNLNKQLLFSILFYSLFSYSLSSITITTNTYLHRHHYHLTSSPSTITSTNIRWISILNFC